MSDGKGGWAVEPGIIVRPESVAREEDLEQFNARYAWGSVYSVCMYVCMYVCLVYNNNVFLAQCL